MSVDVGETYSSPNYLVKDTAGVLADAGTVTVSLNLPDATTAAPTANHPTLGTYNFDYLTSQTGRHWGYVTATGGVLGSLVRKWPIEFTVRSLDHELIVSPEEVRDQLNITSHDHDEELLGYIEAATNVVEGKVGSVVRQSLTENYDGGRTAVLLRHSPVISVTNVTESGTVLVASNYSLAGFDGILTKVSGYSPVCFAPGVGNVQVVYVPGRIVIPGNQSLAAKIIVQHLWETQRGLSSGRPPGALVGDFADVTDQFGRTFSVPRRAVELLEPDLQIGSG